MHCGGQYKFGSMLALGISESFIFPGERASDQSVAHRSNQSNGNFISARNLLS
jgi:hypothetical protein